MRLFAAVPLPESGRADVVAVLARLRATGWPVRWVSDANVHLTLKFFGEVAPERLDVIAEAVQVAAAGAEPMVMRLGGLGAFPSDRHPRIVWLGVEAPPSLELLQDRLERTAEGIGFPPEGAPFRPHITLGRLREGQRLPARAIEQFDGAQPGQPFVADQVILYESVLTVRGPEYTARLTVALSH